MQDVSVNGTVIPQGVIAAEMQNHPAPDPDAAWRQAATALVIRSLLLGEAARQNIAAEAGEDEAEEEATIQALLAREIAV
ncbi:MAG TPA: hypothetical protein VGC80_11280, partial [Acetobacteraceae bacterium]